MATYNGNVRQALASQTLLTASGERMSADPDGLALIGRAALEQVRVRRSASVYAMYTVIEVRQEKSNTDCRMALAARQRLGPETEFPATIDSQCVRHDLTDEQAEAQGELVERLDDDGACDGLISAAPHGGAIEAYTDEQAERVRAVLGAARCSAWRCKGWKPGGGAYARWHITSTAIHRRSFPLLDSIADRRYRYCVAFHGYGETQIAVGGGAPLALREQIRDAVQQAVGARYTAVVATSGPYTGDSPSNFCNWLTQDGTGGVQIEQPLGARQDCWQAIADAVASVFAGLWP
jgi:phage replication-related protein YjqB (UPF0714/DUF867 family)